MDYICHSGGCPGSDMMWETEGLKYGIKTISYSFRNHVQEGKFPKILTLQELAEGWEHVKIADRTLRKNVINLDSPYMRNLLCRNWFQVKNSDAIFAITTKFLTNETVDGGTGWAVQMAIDCDKPTFVFLQGQTGGGWFRYKPITGFECMYGEKPKLTENFAGIGTRELNDYGRMAIRNILKQNFAAV